MSEIPTETDTQANLLGILDVLSADWNRRLDRIEAALKEDERRTGKSFDRARIAIAQEREPEPKEQDWNRFKRPPT